MITTAPATTRTIRCAIYTRKSHEEGLEQEFNSLHAQREAGEAYVASQGHEGWTSLPADYSDGGFSGGTIERPALQKLLADIERGRIDCVVVYKVDRLSRSLMDFAQLMTLFERHEVSFVSVTQQFNTTTSMGRLTLNVLLSFAQFEREIIGERIRDKKLATAKQGKYVGGQPFLGYDIDREKKRLLVNPAEAEMVRHTFQRFIETKSCLAVARELNAKGYRTKEYRAIKNGKVAGGKRWNKVYAYRVLTNRKYLGEIVHKGKSYPGEHQPILDRRLWDQAQRIMGENYHARARKTQQKAPAMLKGILRCGHCGKVMGASHTKRRGRRYRYYVCNNAERNGYGTCPVKSVAAGTIEAAVVDHLRGLFRSPDMIAGTYRAMLEQTEHQQEDQRREKDALQRRLAELRKMVRNVARATGEGSAAAMAEELRKLNEECSTVESRLGELAAQVADEPAEAPAEQEVAEALRNIDPLWDELFPAEKERIVRLLVEQVVVDTDSMTVKLRPVGVGTLVAEMNAVADGVEERLVTA